MDFPRGKKAVPVTTIKEDKELFVTKMKRKPEPVVKEPVVKKPKLINGQLQFSQMAAGMIVLGTVRDVFEKEVYISLPNGLTGVVALDGEEMLTGQFVKCKVVSVERNNRKKRISLSVKPADVNGDIPLVDIREGQLFQCQVTSVEDHGYVLDIGRQGVTAFCPEQDDLLVPGQVKMCCLTSKNSRVWQVTFKQDVVQKSTLKSDNVSDKATIHAGCLVNAKIVQVDATGIKVKILELYHGLIPWSHAFIQGQHEDTDITSLYEVGQKIKARIVYSFDKEDDMDFGLSLLPHILQLHTPLAKFTDGELLQEVSVIKQDTYGLWLSLNDDNSIGFVHISRVADERMESLDGSKFQKGTRHQARVVSFDSFDNVVQLTLQPSVLSAKYLNYQDVKVGDVIPDAIVKKLDSITHTLYLGLSQASDIRAFCPRSHLADLPVLTMPNKFFKEGQKVKVRVLSVDAESRKVAVTHKKTLVTTKLPIITCTEDIQKLVAEDNDVWCHGFVCGVKDYGVLVQFFGEIRGLVHRSQILAAKNDKLEETYKFGQIVKVRLMELDDEGKLRLSFLDSSSKIPRQVISNDETTVYGTVSRLIEGVGLIVRLADGSFGRVHLTDLSESIVECTLENYGIGMKLKCHVLDKKNKQLDLSLKQSDFDGKSVPLQYDDLKVGQVLHGVVKNMSSAGLFVSVSRDITCRVKIGELFDGFVTEWQSKFKVGQIVQGCLIALEDGKVEMSLKLSKVDPDKFAEESVTIDKLEEGSIVTGVIDRLETFGVFVKLDYTQGARPGTQLRALCHRSQLADEPVDDPAEHFEVGDRVRAIVSSVNQDKSQISIAMKPSLLPEMSESEEEDDETSLVSEVEELEAVSVIDAEEDDLLLGEVEPMDIQEELPLPVLTDAVEQNQVEDPQKSLSKKAKIKARQAEEDEITRKEVAIMKDEVELPQSSEDFDRLLLVSPNSSYVWIQYIGFTVQQLGILKARQIAERALDTINFREEKEKFNVWIAYINLEKSFGTPASFKQVLDRAVKHNEPKHVYISLVQIYTDAEEFNKASEVYEFMCKKFKTSCKVWELCAQFKFTQGQTEEARSLLKQAIIMLPKKKHVKVTLKFARLEYTLGDVERGRTIYESLVANFPKRTDIWSTYADIEIKHGDFDYVRRLFERMITLKASTKKMKFMFKKYLQFEKTHGDEQKVLHVVQAAQAYVQSIQETEE